MGRESRGVGSYISHISCVRWYRDSAETLLGRRERQDRDRTSPCVRPWQLK